MPDGSRLATCTTTAACPAGRWSDHFPIVRRGDWQLTESGFEFCLQTGHVGAPCIRLAVAQKRPVLEPNHFRHAFPPYNRPTNRPRACRGDMPGGHRAGAGTEPARRTAVATAAPKGFPDEDAAWIDGLAQRLDVANQLARRVAATTDTELAVEAVRGGAGRRHRLGLVGYRRTVKKLIRGPI